MKRKKITLEKFFNGHKNTLLVLSIFLLVTISLVGKEGYLNNILALLSALITYSILIGIDSKNIYQDSIPLVIFKIVFPIFMVTFCVWVILNVVITLTGEIQRTVWVIFWFVLMIYPGFKFMIEKMISKFKLNPTA